MFPTRVNLADKATRLFPIAPIIIGISKDKTAIIAAIATPRIKIPLIAPPSVNLDVTSRAAAIAINKAAKPIENANILSTFIDLISLSAIENTSITTARPIIATNACMPFISTFSLLLIISTTEKYTTRSTDKATIETKIVPTSTPVIMDIVKPNASKTSAKGIIVANAAIPSRIFIPWTISIITYIAPRIATSPTPILSKPLHSTLARGNSALTRSQTDNATAITPAISPNRYEPSPELNKCSISKTAPRPTIILLTPSQLKFASGFNASRSIHIPAANSRTFPMPVLLSDPNC